MICETPTCILWEQSCLQCSLPTTASAQFVCTCTCIAIFMSLHGPNIAACISVATVLVVWEILQIKDRCGFILTSAFTYIHYYLAQDPGLQLRMYKSTMHLQFMPVLSIQCTLCAQTDLITPHPHSPALRQLGCKGHHALAIGRLELSYNI